MTTPTPTPTWQATMIAAGEAPQSHDDSGSDNSGVAPLFRREFTLETGHGSIAAARLLLSAQGIIEANINGQAVSSNLLTPGWTSYEWRVRYAEYDVKDLLSDTTVIGLALGNGWSHGRLGWSGRNAFYGDEIGAFAQLEITFEDGSAQTVVTDDSWKSHSSSVLANDLYDGETIDARLRSDDWLVAGFADSDWSGVHAIDFDTAKLEPYIGPAVVRWNELPAQKIWTSPAGKTLIDFGQNLVGWIRVNVTGPAGTTVVIRHAEVLENDELGVRPLRTAKATDTYILSGEADVFEPTFTFHGFRYAEIEGWPGELTAEHLTAVAIGSDLKRRGTLTTSNPLLNKFHENVVWGMRGNFVDVPTDCPQRDERLGWTGDIAAFSPTAAYLFDIDDFLSSWLRDLDLEQSHHDGIIGFVIPDVLKYLPNPGEFGDTDTTAIWSDAGVWVPWALYQSYGDTDILRTQFNSMASHVRRIKSLLSPNGVWDKSFQFGDWLDPDAPPEDPIKAKADFGVTATACAYRSADLVSKAAELIGKSAEAAEFRAFANELRQAFNDVYVDNGTILSDCTTVYSLAIVFGLLSADDEVFAGNRLAELAAASGYRISTGFAGTPFITDALTTTGHLDDAYKLLLQQESPSWLYPVTMGATTVWERWDSMLPDGSINPGQMTSFNHYALGAVADWMHRTVGGLSPLTPGYETVLVAPQPGGELTSATTTLETASGTVSVSWNLDGDLLSVDVETPAGVTGVVRLPGQADRAHSGGAANYTASVGSQVRSDAL
jgi:alpha-L-rhamnosidase